MCELKRDKKGRFLPTGAGTKKFNQRYIKRSDVDAIFMAGFEVARRTPKTHSAKAALEAYQLHGNNLV